MQQSRAATVGCRNRKRKYTCQQSLHPSRPVIKLVFSAFRTKKLIEENEIHLDEIQKILEVSGSFCSNCRTFITCAIASFSAFAVKRGKKLRTERTCICCGCMVSTFGEIHWNRIMLIRNHSYQLCIGTSVKTVFKYLAAYWFTWKLWSRYFGLSMISTYCTLSNEYQHGRKSKC